MTHCRFACENPRSVLIEGSATFTIATSRMTMNCATTMSASALQRRSFVLSPLGVDCCIICLPKSLVETTIAHTYTCLGYTCTAMTTTPTPLTTALQAGPSRELL